MTDNLEQIENLSTVKRTLLALKQMQSKLEALERAKYEPIAIVGMGCRFPGHANSPAAFWQLLENGINAITEVPPEHWDIEQYYDPKPNTQGKIYTRHGGFLPHLYDFDAQFFRLSPREAVSLDPQQRLLLEVCWEALENAAIAPDRLFGSETGVFIGISGNDYWHRLLQKNATEIDAYLATGNCHSMAAGRISYLLGLTGPSLAVDTACSSSLVSVHLAVNSLRNQECEVAIAGGVNRLLLPEVSINFCQAKMLSPEGRCATFDAVANGFVRAEGCGIMVLKRLSEAIASRDRILAVIAGSAVNQDGRSSGLTVPNGVSQQAVIRKALANANLTPLSVDYLETHGTGTSLGDPIEIGALDAVFSQDRPVDRPLIIGSVKTNIGHCEAAAGMASLIKAVLALNHGKIPPHLHLKNPNPHLNWDQLPLKIPTETIPWPLSDQPRIAGVSSFGFSGTNAHVIVTETPSLPSVEAKLQRPWHLLTLSAKTEKALSELVSRYQDFLVNHPESNLGDICLTANTGRSHFNHRLCVIATSTAELQQKLASFVKGEKTTDIWQGKIAEGKQPKIAFLLTESESEYLNLGQQLYQTQPIFQGALQQCEEIFNSYLDQSLLKIIYPQNKAKKPEKFQRKIAIFALQYALLKLWQFWGIEPKTLICEGVGEYVAAIAAGVFNLKTGLKLAAIKLKLLKLDSEETIVKINFSKPNISIINYNTQQIINSEITMVEHWLNQRGELSGTERQNSPQLDEQILLNLGNFQPNLLNFSNIYLSSLALEKEDWQQILTTLAQLYLKGIAIDWLNFDRDYQYQKITLPNYPFQRQFYRK